VKKLGGYEAELVDILKKNLRAKGFTYAYLAKELGLSEASVKRVFAERTLTLSRFCAVCEIAGLSFAELARQLRTVTDSGYFSEEQEHELARDPKLFSYFYILMNGSPPARIVKEFEITAAESSRFLVKLDKLGLIELHPKDVVKPLVNRHVKWRPRGELMARYETKMREEFFASSFQDQGEQLRFVTGKLSPKSLARLERKIAQLLVDYDDLNEFDESVATPPHENVCLLVAYRPYTFSVIASLKKRAP
jgi:transcriptional regulator with XRE-family HTH domain